ncbi:helix-turn-helix domain-containing protein [Faecalispora anaeroviscerum]|uniref:helix-turn-helix domain-containing protein n=1 Tax=Faecalispora anaeroviscerum TaxID=2991836 RepID=UPI0024BB9074|nr:helix-turn-helix transcriptional regulator [Faecalispora anaeroviscerum]
MRIDKLKLAYAMLKAGIDSSKKLAEVAQVSVNTISRILNGGSAKVPTVRKIAAALNVDPMELIEREA